MRNTLLIVLGMGLASIASAQEWEIGGMGGAGFMNGMSVTSLGASGTTGFASGGAFGAFVGSNLYPKLSGEIRYLYQMDDLKVSGGGTSATFAGVSHAISYDFVYHPMKRRSKAQPFVAAGAGVKIFRGTGKEQAFQPLSLVRRSRWRFVAGIAIGLAETGAWVWGILYMVARSRAGG